MENIDEEAYNAGLRDSNQGSVKENCSYFDNKPLTELFGLLTGSKKKISQKIGFLMFRESIYAAKCLTRDIKEMKIDTFEMVAVYQQIRQDISEDVITDYFYTHMTNMFQELSSSIPACEKMTINELKTIITKGDDTSFQKGGTNLAKLIQSFLVSLFIFLAFLGGKIDANINDGNVTQQGFDDNKSALNFIFSVEGESKEYVKNSTMATTPPPTPPPSPTLPPSPTPAALAIITPGILFKKSMQEAIVQGVVWEVVTTISESKDTNIKNLATKTDLSYAIKEIGKTRVVSEENIQKLGLTLNEQKNVLSLYNVAYNNWDLVISKQVAELSRILTDCDEAYQSLQLEFSASMLNLVDTLDPPKNPDQEILKAMNGGLRKFLLANGFAEETNGELVQYNNEATEEPADSEKNKGTALVGNAQENTAKKEGGLFWTALAATYRTMQSNAEYLLGETGTGLVQFIKDSAPESVVDQVKTAEQTAQIVVKNETEAEKERKREEEIKIAKAKNEEEIKIAKAKNIKLRLTDALNNLSAAASSIISPVHYDYSPDTKIISIHYDNNAILFRMSLMRFYKEVILSPKLDELKGLMESDKVNWFSQLTTTQKTDYQRVLSLGDRITYTQFALSQEAGAITAASYNGSNYQLLKITTTRVGSALIALEIAGNTSRPMRNLEDSQNALITEEEKERLKKVGDDYWKNIEENSKDAIKRVMGTVAGIANAATYQSMMAFLETIGGPLDAAIEYYNTHPTNCIIIVTTAGILLLGVTSFFWIAPVTGVVTAATTSLSGVTSLTMKTLNAVAVPIIYITGSIVGINAVKEVVLRGPVLFGFKPKPELTGPEQQLNWVILKILEFSGMNSPCGEGGVCITPPDVTTMWSVIIFGGMILFIYKKDKIVAYVRTTASQQTTAIASGPASPERRGGDLTTPARRFLLNGTQNPAALASSGAPSGASSGASSGGYIKHKVGKSSNKNRKANKTKKPRRTLHKNKKSKHNSSQKKNKNKKTKTKKHKYTIRHK